MRRPVAVAVVATILAITTTAVATEWQSFKDTFESGGYAGDDGSLSWNGPWVEDGESTNPGAGAVRVVQQASCKSGRCVRVNAALIGEVGAHRIADTAELVSLELRYDIKRQGGISVTNLLIQVSSNGGSSWQTVRTLSLLSSDSSPVSYSNDITGFISESTGVRFITSSLLSLGATAHIDNVEILGALEATTTTTSSTTTSSTTTSSTTTTSTTTTSTATTSSPSTTTTVDDATTSTTHTSTTTGSTNDSPKSTTPNEQETTSTTRPPTSTTSAPGSDDDSVSSSSTTTTPSDNTIGVTPDDPGSAGVADMSPNGSGIRAAARGLQANFQGDLFGEVRTVSALNGVDLQADYKMAVEVIRSSWAWMALLGLVIAWAIITGLDRRRDQLDP